MIKSRFINSASGFGSHRPLLFEALEATKDSIFPVVELGCGDNSTPYLMEYCERANRVLFSFDSDKEWASRYDSDYVKDWEKHPLWMQRYSVCLLDLAPGEYRRVALMKLQSDIIVIHDSEPIGWNASDYKVRPLFSRFKYVKDDIPKEKGAPWTTCLSRTIDVSKFKI